MDQAAVTCQICSRLMSRRPVILDLGPNDWRPSGDRLAAILSEVYECASCGGMTIRPGILEAERHHAA